MSTLTLPGRRKNVHAVALGRIGKRRKPLDEYGDLTAAQQRAHYSWLVSIRHARAAGRPAPQPPPWVRMRALLLDLGHNERTARIHQADRTAERGYQSLVEFLEHLPASLRTPIHHNLAVIAGAIVDLMLLAGVDAPRESEMRRGLYSTMPNRG